MTMSTFGKYPSDGYIERRPTFSHNTSFTRVLKWVAISVGQAEGLVWSHFGRRPYDATTSRRFSSALDLPEVAGAGGDSGDLAEFDIESCVSSGGISLVLAQMARLLSGLWKGSAAAQLLALRPILPQFGHQLFELATLGTIVAGMDEVASGSDWVSSAPLAAASKGLPSISLKAEEGDWSAYYQTIPSAYRDCDSPYRVLSAELTGGSLRPDIWIRQVVSGHVTEVVVECKYSLDPSYVATGITQSLAYAAEFPETQGSRRLHIVVGPEEVVPSATCWDGQIVLANPSGVREICQRAFVGELDALLSG